jgi:hypothetical protein
VTHTGFDVQYLWGKIWKTSENWFKFYRFFPHYRMFPYLCTMILKRMRLTVIIILFLLLFNMSFLQLSTFNAYNCGQAAKTNIKIFEYRMDCIICVQCHFLQHSFLSPLPHVPLSLHYDLKKDAINEFGIKYWTSNPVWVTFQEHGSSFYERPISKFFNIEWIVSFVCNVIFYNISVNQIGSFIGTVLKKKKHSNLHMIII